MYFKVSPPDAEDLCEDLFVKVWEKIKTYKEQKNGSFRAWIFTIAHNMVIDYYRKNRTTIPLDEIEGLEMEYSDMEVERETDLNITSEQLTKALSMLKEDYKQAVILKFINDLSNEEISAIMDKSEGAVRILLHRGLKEMNRIFKMLYPEKE